MNTGSDYQLGRQIGSLIADQQVSGLSPNTLLSQLQDLLGADTALLGPLRDLVMRPSFRQLLSGQQQSVLMGGRDALLQDLAATYSPALLSRLVEVLDGCLGLPPSATSAPPAQSGYSPGQQGGYSVLQDGGAATTMLGDDQPTSVSGSWPPPGAQAIPAPQAQPWSAPGTAAPTYVQVPVATPPSGSSPLTALLVALISVFTGAVLLGLGWLLLSNRPVLVSSSSSSTPSSSGSSSSSSPAQAPATTQEPAKGTTASPPQQASGAWGGASDYKFGMVPGGNYPDSCAFSQTDAAGRQTIDKSRVEYWACRDIGGDPNNGYRVAWADGKETSYTFQSDGNGMVVGTNGSGYPMRWRNDSHAGEQIIVISHEDGATTWIPGNIQ